MRDVMLSQLNYHAAGYLDDGVDAVRRPFGAHPFYVPAQLFPTAEGYLALFVTHDGFWRSLCAETGLTGWDSMAERAANRDLVIAAVSAVLATDTAANRGTARAGILAAAVRTLGEALDATPEAVVQAGTVPQVRCSIGMDGYLPDYRRAPTLASTADRARSAVVVDDDGAVRDALTGQHVPLVDLVVVQGIVDPHGRGALAQHRHAGAAVAGLAGERRRQRRGARIPGWSHPAARQWSRSSTVEVHGHLGSAGRHRGVTRSR